MKGMELVIKARNSVDRKQISIGKFPPGKRNYLFRSYAFPEIFQWDEPKSRVLFKSQPEFPEYFGKMENAPLFSGRSNRFILANSKHPFD